MKYANYLALFLCLCLLTACAPKTPAQPSALERSSFLLDTVIQITLYDWEDEETLTRAMAEIARLETLFRVQDAESEVAKLSQASGKTWVNISPETEALLHHAKTMGERSQGYFDVTSGKLSALWNIAKGGYFPTDAERETAMDSIDYTALQIEDGRAYLTQAGMQLDLGGIAKGYIADQVKALLLAEGVRSAKLDLGGNILLLGTKPDGVPFRVGVQDPEKARGEIKEILAVSDQSIVTAGVDERYFEHEGKRYHHILDPFTGFPAETGILSVTIVSQESVIGDAYATSCLLLGLEKGLALVENTPETEALFVLADGTTHATTGLDAYRDAASA